MFPHIKHHTTAHTHTDTQRASAYHSWTSILEKFFVFVCILYNNCVVDVLLCTICPVFFLLFFGLPFSWKKKRFFFSCCAAIRVFTHLWNFSSSHLLELKRFRCVQCKKLKLKRGLLMWRRPKSLSHTAIFHKNPIDMFADWRKIMDFFLGSK